MRRPTLNLALLLVAAPALTIPVSAVAQGATASETETDALSEANLVRIQAEFDKIPAKG